MIAEFARGERTTPGEAGRRVLDVSGVETARVTDYVGKWFGDVDDVHIEHKAGKTFVVVGE